MADGKLILELTPDYDRNGKKYFMAKLKGPFLIDCSEKNGGVCFMVFVSEEGNEELQISHITNPKDKDVRR